MITSGIRDVKNNLSRYLAQVKEGEEVLITDHGKPIARIIKEDERYYLREKMNALVRKGLVLLPVRRLNKEKLLPIEVPGKPVSEMVLEDRR